TDPALAEGVRIVGAEPQIVARSLERLGALKTKLDEHAPQADAGIHAWHVDVRTNSIVVQAAQPNSAATRAFVETLGADGSAVQVVASAERPRPLYDVRGGD